MPGWPCWLSRPLTNPSRRCLHDETQCVAVIALIDRGRVHAILASLQARWDGFNEQQRAHALELLGELAACYCQQDGCALEVA